VQERSAIASAVRRVVLGVCAVLVVIVFGGSGPVAAADMPTLILDNAVRGQVFTPHAQRLLDPTAALGPDEVTDQEWMAPGSVFPNTYGGAAWLRLKLDRPTDAMRWYLSFDYPLFDHIAVYQREPGGAWTAYETGRLRPWGDRPVRTHNFAFPLLQGTGPVEILVRVETTSRLELPATLYAETAFFETQKTQRVLYGGFFGFLAALLIYSLFIGASLRDRVFAWYCLSLLCCLVFQSGMDGIAYEILWPNWVLWNYWSPFIGGLGVFFFSALFTREFLETAQHHPRIDLALKGCVLLFGGMMVLLPFVERGYTIGLMGGAAGSFIYSPLVIVAGVLALRRGHQPARFFILAHSFYMAGFALMAFRFLEILPVSTLTLHGARIGASLDMLLLALALADRVNSLRRDREALIRIADLQKENLQLAETERRKAAELEDALGRLRHTQQQLVQREKLASLGQLVAGVAHEINTPLGNSVTASSFARARTEEVHSMLRDRTLTRSQLEAFLAEQVEALDILARNLERASDLVQSFKQVAADQTSEQPRRIDLSDYLSSVAQSLEPMLKRAQVALTLDAAEGMTLDIRPGLLAQVVTNLVQNGVVHAFCAGRPRADQPKQIHVSAFPDGPDHVRISVTDNGVGMTAEVRQKAFDPFFTTKRDSGGTGLGLHIVHNIVSGPLKGEIAIESQEGQGTAFHLRLPRRA